MLFKKSNNQAITKEYINGMGLKWLPYKDKLPFDKWLRTLIDLGYQEYIKENPISKEQEKELKKEIKQELKQ